MRKIILLASLLLATAVFGQHTIEKYFVSNGSFTSASNGVYYKGLTKLITQDLKNTIKKQRCVKLISHTGDIDHYLTPKISGISVKDNCSTSFWSEKEIYLF
jgi:hypothetical protein